MNKEKNNRAKFWWCPPVILASWEAEIRDLWFRVQSQPRQIVCKNLSLKNSSQKKVGKVIKV
jgi:hypothetical protein